MRQLAMGAVELGPRTEQLQERGPLPIQQPMQRLGRPRRCTIKAPASVPACTPPRHATIVELKHLTGPPSRPGVRHGMIDKLQQPDG